MIECRRGEDRHATNKTATRSIGLWTSLTPPALMILRADLADQSKPNTLYLMLACENAFSAIDIVESHSRETDFAQTIAPNDLITWRPRNRNRSILVADLLAFWEDISTHLFKLKQAEG